MQLRNLASAKFEIEYRALMTSDVNCRLKLTHREIVQVMEESVPPESLKTITFTVPDVAE